MNTPGPASPSQPRKRTAAIAGLGPVGTKVCSRVASEAGKLLSGLVYQGPGANYSTKWLSRMPDDRECLGCLQPIEPAGRWRDGVALTHGLTRRGPASAGATTGRRRAHGWRRLDRVGCGDRASGDARRRDPAHLVERDTRERVASVSVVQERHRLDLVRHPVSIARNPADGIRQSPRRRARPRPIPRTDPAGLEVATAPGRCTCCTPSTMAAEAQCGRREARAGIEVIAVRRAHDDAVSHRSARPPSRS